MPSMFDRVSAAGRRSQNGKTIPESLIQKNSTFAPRNTTGHRSPQATRTSSPAPCSLLRFNFHPFPFAPNADLQADSTLAAFFTINQNVGQFRVEESSQETNFSPRAPPPSTPASLHPCDPTSRHGKRYAVGRLRPDATEHGNRSGQGLKSSAVSEGAGAHATLSIHILCGNPTVVWPRDSRAGQGKISGHYFLHPAARAPAAAQHPQPRSSG